MPNKQPIYQEQLGVLMDTSASFRPAPDHFFSTWLRPDKTGLPATVIFRAMEHKDETTPYLYVNNSRDHQLSANLITIAVSEYPEIIHKAPGELDNKDIKEIFQFIKANLPAILRHWNLETDSYEFYQELKLHV